MRGCKEGVVKKLALTIVPLLLMLSLSSVAAQSVGDLLKQKLKAALPTATANNGKQ